MVDTNHQARLEAIKTEMLAAQKTLTTVKPTESNVGLIKQLTQQANPDRLKQSQLLLANNLLGWFKHQKGASTSLADLQGFLNREMGKPTL